MIDEEYEDTIVGTPQSGNISPLLANILLNELDRELGSKRTGLRSLRLKAEVSNFLEARSSGKEAALDGRLRAAKFEEIVCGKSRRLVRRRYALKNADRAGFLDKGDGSRRER